KRGRTFSTETFWLIAAMRSNERRGPGMMTVCCGAAVGVVPAKQAPALKHRDRKTTREASSARRGRFIAGYLFGTLDLRQLRPTESCRSHGTGGGKQLVIVSA